LNVFTTDQSAAICVWLYNKCNSWVSYAKYDAKRLELTLDSSDSNTSNNGALKSASRVSTR